MSRWTTLVLVTLAFGCVATARIADTFTDPIRWTPDALYYQVEVLKLRGLTEREALSEVFKGPISAELRRRDPEQTGNWAWVEYNSKFYARRKSVPLAAAALYPLTGERSLQLVSSAGYVAAVMLTVVFLGMLFPLGAAAVAGSLVLVLPPLRDHASYPLSDSWGLALLIAAFIAASLVLRRGLAWLALWIPVVVALSFTRDHAWLLVLGTALVFVVHRSRRALVLAATALVAGSIPNLWFPVPYREVLAHPIAEHRVPTDTSWSFIVHGYPAALADLVRSNGGLVRREDWYTGIFFAVGLVLLFALARGLRSTETATLLKGATVAAILTLLAAPAFSAFRLELVLVPMAAYGFALLTESYLPGRSRAAVMAGQPAG